MNGLFHRLRRAMLSAALVLSATRVAVAQQPQPVQPPPAQPGASATPGAAPPEAAPQPSAAPRFAARSTRGPLYVQVSPAGYGHSASARGFCGGQGCGGWPGWRPELEVGYHLMQRYDGPVVAVRQAFMFTAGPANVGGATVGRLGWDFAFPLRSFEIVASPYTGAGVGYALADGAVGFQANFFGVDAKFFFSRGLYAFLKPLELGMQCFEKCWFQYVFGAGVGLALPMRASAPDAAAPEAR